MARSYYCPRFSSSRSWRLDLLVDVERLLSLPDATLVARHDELPHLLRQPRVGPAVSDGVDRRAAWPARPRRRAAPRRGRAAGRPSPPASGGSRPRGPFPRPAWGPSLTRWVRSLSNSTANGPLPICFRAFPAPSTKVASEIGSAARTMISITSPVLRLSATGGTRLGYEALARGATGAAGIGGGGPGFRYPSGSSAG